MQPATLKERLPAETTDMCSLVWVDQPRAITQVARLPAPAGPKLTIMNWVTILAAELSEGYMSANLRRPTSLASLLDDKVQYFIMPSFIIKQALIHFHQIIHFMYVYRSNEIPLIQVAAYMYRLVGLEISLLFNSRRDIHYNNIPLTKRLTEDFLFNQQIHELSNCSFSHRFRRPHNLVFTELVHDLSSVEHSETIYSFEVSHLGMLWE